MVYCLLWEMQDFYHQPYCRHRRNRSGSPECVMDLRELASRVPICGYAVVTLGESVAENAICGP